ncbi:MAG: UDP-N-acetylmuramate--L-alanine ligase [Chitinophagales bacterium]
MNWKEIHSIYFVGIGGIGMSALARYFLSHGKIVAGYDLTATELTTALQKEGIEIHFEDNADLLPNQIDLVIYTPAIPSSSILMKALKEKGLPIFKRAQILGELSKDKFTIAVAGSHGKTSVSAMLLHLLKSADIDCAALLGGIALNYQSNYVGGTSDILVVEADEYDRSFLQLHPDMAIITSIDTDHLDVYGSRENIVAVFKEFAERISKTGTLIQHKNDVALSGFENSISYAFSNENGAQVSNIESSKGNLVFDLHLNKIKVENCCLEAGALHNIENMLAAALVAEKLGADASQIRNGIASYKGVKRRFELIYQDESITYIDDYAHHPKEIETLIKAVRKLYPEEKITVFFQPHLYSRTKDLAFDFAQSLSLADVQFLLPIYPAREKAIPGVSSALIAEYMHRKNCQMIGISEIEAALQDCGQGVVLSVGAGDIDKQVAVIKNYFETRKPVERR